MRGVFFDAELWSKVIFVVVGPGVLALNVPALAVRERRKLRAQRDPLSTTGIDYCRTLLRVCLCKNGITCLFERRNEMAYFWFELFQINESPQLLGAV